MLEAEKPGGTKPPGFLKRNLHKILSVDELTHEAVCEQCGPTLAIRRTDGDYWQCPSTKRKSAYRHFRKTFCEWCGFKGHPSQLSVDHIDENHFNDCEENYQTLCLRCHALKSWLFRTKPQKQWMYFRERFGAVAEPPVIDVSRPLPE